MTINCRDWRAWLNTMPPKPDDFHVVGDVVVSNPGVQAVLTMREPQGINPTILVLDLHLVQQAGDWLQVMTCASAHFIRVMPEQSANYQSVDIYSAGEKIAAIDFVSIVS